MINIDEINKEIDKLEECNYTTYEVCEKLAILYIVRDHLPVKVNNVMKTPMMSSPTV